jgi:acyl carrier protein
MFEIIKSIIEEQLGMTDTNIITLSTTLREDLDADSLDAVEIIMSIEDEFDIEIPDEIAERLQTVGQIVDYIENLKL